MLNKIKNFFENLQKRNDTVFTISIALIALIIKIPGVILGDILLTSLGLSYPLFSTDMQVPQINAIDFIGAVIVAPPIETFLGQFLPITILRRFTKNNKILITFSALIFSLLHLPVLGFLFAAFSIGLLFSWGYIVKLKYGRKKAFFLITLSHAIHNLIAFAATLFS